MTILLNDFLKQYELNGKHKKFCVKELKNYFNHHIDENDILSQFKGNLVLVLHGSTTRNIDDDYSDLDLWLILSKDEMDYYDRISEHRFIPITIHSKEAHANPISLIEFEACFNSKINITLINEIQDSEIIIDDKNIFHKYKQLANQTMRDEVQYAHFFYNYVQMRGYHRGCDHPIQRHDEIAALIDMAFTIKYALQCTFTLDKKPYPYEKWLHYFAHFYPTPGLLIENINNILNDIKSNQKCFLGPESENKIS